uniref:Uncharacterized protein n=1 Tax=Ditylenchus dipsaci TaxID=166011 RepID=A0A915DNL8_9BILA
MHILNQSILYLIFFVCVIISKELDVFVLGKSGPIPRGNIACKLGCGSKEVNRHVAESIVEDVLRKKVQKQ